MNFADALEGVETKMNLYLVHCGFYDSEVCDGLYGSHVNFFVAAESFEDARLRAKAIPEFSKRKMHIDGLQAVHAVAGYKVSLQKDDQLEGQSVIVNHKHRDLAPKPPVAPE